MANADDTLAVTHQPTLLDCDDPPSGTLAGGATFAGRYEVLGLLGTGGMGAVYRVRDRVLDEVVALKLIRPERGGDQAALARFKQEVRLARKVTHPCVVRTFDLGEVEGTWFLTMEYVEGTSLRRRLVEGPPLGPAEILGFTRGITAGLQAAHDAGVVHRDLKPDNVLIGTDGRVLLTDFGIARARAAESSQETLSGIVGTPAYMAPEQVDGLRPIGPAADLYALGCLLFEMVCGRRVWEGDNPLIVAAARLVRPPPDPRDLRPEIPAAVADAIRRCLAREPEGRFARATDVARALDEAAAAMPQAPAPQALSVPTTQMPSLALVPLRPAGGEDPSFARGLGEELVDALSMMRGLRVRPLAGPMAESEQPREWGRRLQVSLVLEGTVRRHEDRLRLTMRLHSVEDGFQIWAQRFDGDASDLLGVADDVARAVAGALASDVPGERRAASDAEAVRQYLLGRDALRRNWFTNPGEGRDLLLAASTRAPSDATILSWLSIARSRCAFWDRSGDFDAELYAARTEANRALALAPTMAEARLAAASIHLEMLEYVEVARQLRGLVLDSPGIPRVQQMAGGLLLEIRRIPEALRHLRAAVTLDPSSHAPVWEMARAYALAGEWGRMENLLSTAPEHDDAREIVFATRCRMALWQRDRSLLPPKPSVDPAALRPWGPLVGGLTMYEVVSSGQLEGPMLAFFERPIPRVAPRYFGILTQIRVELLVGLGSVREAMAELEKAVAAGLCDVAWLEGCPLLAPIRSSPAGQVLLAAVRARAEAVGRAFDGA